MIRPVAPSQGILPTPTQAILPRQAQIPAPSSPTDRYSLTPVATGSIPATIGIMPFTGPEAVSQAIHKLQANPSQQNLRDSLAGFRVALRDLSTPDLPQAKTFLEQQIRQTSDYRTQVLLDQLHTELRLALNDFSFPPTPDFVADSGPAIVDKALIHLKTDPAEAHFRTTLAGFRVAMRSLDQDGLKAAQARILSQMAVTNDYRTQVYLDEIHTEILLALPDFAQPATPDLSAGTGLAAVDKALVHLQMLPTEENFRLSQYGFRVALRSLSQPELLAARDHITLHIKETQDFRTQLFLDNIRFDVLEALDFQG